MQQQKARLLQLYIGAPDLVKDIIRKCTRQHELAFLVYDNDEKHQDMDTSQIIDGYTEESYHSMTTDIVRNVFYQHLIEMQPLHSQWLEIGPGGDAVLTKIILKYNQPNKIVSIEGNQNSFDKFYKWKTHQSNSKIIDAYSGYSNHPPIVSQITSLHKSFDVLISEIFGSFASSEGIARVLSDAKKDFNLIKHTSIQPQYCATFFQPLHLQASDVLQAKTEIGQTLLMIRQLPFAKNSGTSNLGLLEYFDFGSCNPIPLTPHFTSSFQYEQPTLVNGLGFFIWIGLPNQRQPAKTMVNYMNQGSQLLPNLPLSSLFNHVSTNDRSFDFPAASAPLGMTSNYDFPLHCCAKGWKNPFIVFPQPLLCQGTITIESWAFLETLQPHYKFKITTTTMDRKEVVLELPFHEIYGSVSFLKSL